MESSFTHRTVDPTGTVILIGTKPFLLIWMVLADTEFWIVGDTDPVVRIAWGVATTVASGGGVAREGGGVVAGVIEDCVGAGWVQPQTSTISTATMKITTILFIMRSQASRNKIMPCAKPAETGASLEENDQRKFRVQDGARIKDLAGDLQSSP